MLWFTYFCVLDIFLSLRVCCFIRAIVAQRLSFWKVEFQAVTTYYQYKTLKIQRHLVQQKIAAPLPLIKVFPMRPLLVLSISRGRTLNTVHHNYHTQKSLSFALRWGKRIFFQLSVIRLLQSQEAFERLQKCRKMCDFFLLLWKWIQAVYQIGSHPYILYLKNHIKIIFTAHS